MLAFFIAVSEILLPQFAENIPQIVWLKHEAKAINALIESAKNYQSFGQYKECNKPISASASLLFRL